MRKRFCFAALSLVMATLFLFTGCGDKKTVNQPNEPTTSFTYWGPLRSSLASVKSYNDTVLYKELEKRTGIHIDFLHPTAGQEKAQFNLMIASRELPDMIETDWINNYSGGPEKAINDNVIIALNDYIEKHAPNFYNAVNGDGEFADSYYKGSRTDSGKFFSFPSFNTGHYRIFGGLMIRSDWLDDLGLEVPETIDEWTTMLRAFKEEKGAKAPFTGLANDILAEHVQTFNGAFGIYRGFYLDGETVKFGPLESGYKEFVKLMRDWYAEGLLDNDYMTNNSSIVNSKITTGTSGALFGYIGGGMGVYLEQMKDKDPNYNLVGAPLPTLNKGDVNNFSYVENDVLMPVLAITTACSDPETAVKWADYAYSEEGFKLFNFGVEGVSHNMVDGKHVYTDEIMNNPDGYGVVDALSIYTRAKSAAPGFNNAADYLEQFYVFDQQKDAFKLWSNYFEEGSKKVLPYVTPTIEESEEMATLKTSITTFIDEIVLKFIIGEEPMENYDNFIDKLKNVFNVDRYVELQQTAYDRYLRR